MNYKLKKPRGYEVSEPITVLFGAQEIPAANLKKGGLTIQTSIMVGYNSEWHEIEIADLALDSVHLPSFKHHIESNGLKLSDLGLVESAPDYELVYSDFIKLSEQFPDYGYVEISKLHEYEKRNGLPNGMYHKKETLRMLTNQKLSIADYITQCEERKHKIISDSRNAPVVYEEVVNTEKPQHAIAVDTVPVPVPVPVPEDGVSISLFENLSPAKITELHNLRLEQQKIKEENPVIEITNSKTYAEAKKTKAVLLSASTKIDGKNGIFANAKRLINDFKSKFDKEGEEIAKITRDPHDKQQVNIKNWEDRVLLQVQNRTKMLTEVPFTYNSETGNYTIGTLTVTQKDIENDTDAEFSAWVNKGKEIKKTLDLLKGEQDTKIAAQEKEIAELKAMIQQLLPKTDIPAQALTAASEITNIQKNFYKEVPTVEELNLAKENVINNLTADNSAGIFEPLHEKQYELPDPENKLLNDLDLQNVSVLEETQYLQYRDGFIYGLSKCAEALQAVFDITDKNIVKSEEIKKLIKIWK